MEARSKDQPFLPDAAHASRFFALFGSFFPRLFF